MLLFRLNCAWTLPLARYTAYPVEYLAGSCNFNSGVWSCVFSAADRVAACYRGVWPVNETGEDTLGILPTSCPLIIVPRHQVFSYLPRLK